MVLLYACNGTMYKWLFRSPEREQGLYTTKVGSHMATHNLGKLKIKTSEDGIAFRFGEGKIHRLSLGRKGRNADPDYNDYNED